MMLAFRNLLIGNPTSFKLPNLIKLTEGVYTKSVVSPLSHKLVPCKPLRQLAIEYLTYLGIQTFPSSYDKKYNEGKTTQVPTGRVIGVGFPVDIKFGYDGKYISFEYNKKNSMIVKDSNYNTDDKRRIISN